MVVVVVVVFVVVVGVVDNEAEWSVRAARTGLKSSASRLWKSSSCFWPPTFSGCRVEVVPDVRQVCRSHQIALYY
jgi:hypothetical protein